MQRAIKKEDIRYFRERIFLILVLVFMLVVVVRLINLQLLSHRKYLARSIGNKVELIRIAPPRGEIYDRAGVPLAVNKTNFALKYFARKEDLDFTKAKAAADKMSKERKTTSDEDIQQSGLTDIGSSTSGVSSSSRVEASPVVLHVAQALGLDPQELLKDIERQRELSYSFQPITLAENLTFEQVAHFEENRENFPSLFIEASNYERYYPLGEKAVHIVGYVGRPSRDDLEKKFNPSISPDDLVGKEGVELAFDSILFGVPGQRYIEVDKNRNFMGEVKLVPPKKGKDLFLTIDAEIQSKAYELLAGRPGAIIVMKPRTGEILALVSSPSYDPNIFRTKQGASYIRSILSQKDYPPMLNRAYGNAYAPGSTFKPVVLISALDTGKVSEGTTFFCSGKLEVGNRIFYCWERKGHGKVDLIDALGKSCDVSFYQIGLMLGPELINKYALMFGFGRPTGLPFPNEAVGLLPTPQWKRAHYAGEPYTEVDRIWYEGDTANLAIGQGFILTSVIQVLMMINTIANDGVVVAPTIIKGMREGEEIIPYPVDEGKKLPLIKEELEIVKKGLRRASLPGGTADLIPPSLKVAGKTGTAEVWKGKPHSWFVGYMPYDKPKLSFIIFFENGGSSLTTAVPAAKKLATFLNNYLLK